MTPTWTPNADNLKLRVSDCYEGEVPRWRYWPATRVYPGSIIQSGCYEHWETGVTVSRDGNRWFRQSRRGRISHEAGGIAYSRDEAMQRALELPK